MLCAKDKERSVKESKIANLERQLRITTVDQQVYLLVFRHMPPGHLSPIKSISIRVIGQMSGDCAGADSWGQMPKPIFLIQISSSRDSDDIHGLHSETGHNLTLFTALEMSEFCHF